MCAFGTFERTAVNSEYHPMTGCPVVRCPSRPATPAHGRSGSSPISEVKVSFLHNAKISTKILSLVIPICVIGVAGIAAVSYNYKVADTAYNEFITNDATSSTEMYRANTALVAIGYDVGQILATIDNAEKDEAKVDYKENVASLKARFEKASMRRPEMASEIGSFRDSANAIVSRADKILELEAANQIEDVLVQAKGIAGDIRKWRRDIRSWNEANSKALENRSASLTAQTNSTIVTSLVLISGVFIAGIILYPCLWHRGASRDLSSGCVHAWLH